ncbi:MAG: TIGR01777 family oxidoreductase [Candidatus Coatesbacteria bacterium]|nr:MAG: TIGR01777 family oxidoreductase [Candidatus Coatesbacteria bacterium]
MTDRLVIITGGTGFIGRGLTTKLVADGYDVAVLTRRADAYSNRDHIQYVQWDGRTSAGWGALADGADAIVNLAGANIAGKRWNAAVKDTILRSRLAAGEAVVEAVSAAGVKPGALVQASAVGIYGSRDNDELDESALPGDGFLANVARRWESSTAAVENAGVRRTVVRSGIVLGRDGGVLPRWSRPFKFFVGGPLAGGGHWVPWIHYDDEIEAIRFLIKDDNTNGVYNLCAPEPLKNRDISRIIGKALKRPWWWPIPGPLIRALYGEMADALLLASERAVPRRLLEAGFVFRFYNAEAALRELTTTERMDPL